MKIAIDLNVLLDVAQNRPEFYQNSEEVLARARGGDYEAVIPAHLLTTSHYVMAKFSGRSAADAAVDGLLADFMMSLPFHIVIEDIQRRHPFAKCASARRLARRHQAP